MSDTEYSSLRFVVPVDPSRADDAALLEAFAGVPNGLIGTFARMLLLRALPRTKDELDALMLNALADQSARKRVRGRPSAKSGKTAARAAFDPSRAKPVGIKSNEGEAMAPTSSASSRDAMAHESHDAPVGTSIESMSASPGDAGSGARAAEPATAPARKVSARVANLVG
ncbi:hypothetical protein [Pandoraea sp. ISTKB]|uniref:hypothetical protein n=1 Tax=Pandoraea sp. ISTKB TaxID=1586708 RepID=UPI000847701D|nr:hypothetical protein [Pandoraea sp. ISTKB]ODP35042.1 hypothetical protein A9762_11800 [Pandoraea sp. ISTKB]